MEEKVTLEIPKGFVQVIYQALDIATKQVGLNGAEALVVVAKEIAKQAEKSLQSLKRLKKKSQSNA